MHTKSSASRASYHATSPASDARTYSSFNRRTALCCRTRSGSCAIAPTLEPQVESSVGAPWAPPLTAFLESAHRQHPSRFLKLRIADWQRVRPRQCAHDDQMSQLIVDSSVCE